MLVLGRQRSVSRHELADLLWPDQLPSTWSAGLRNVMASLRAVLDEITEDGGRALVSKAGTYQLCLPATVELEVDVEVARGRIEMAEVALAAGAYEEAAAEATAARLVLARTFLAGVDGDWIDRTRADLGDWALRGLEVLSRARLGLGQTALAAAAGEAVEMDPTRESAHRCLMAAHEAAGNRAAALRAYEQCRTTLAEELGVMPSAETEAAYVNLLGTEPPPPIRSVLLPGRLPLVGRERPLAVLTELLDSAARGLGGVALVSGEPGIGKTRLVRAAIEEAVRHGAGVLWGACPEPEWSPGFVPIVEMLPALATRLEGRDRTTADDLLARLTSGLSDDSASQEGDAIAVGEVLRRLILIASAASPVVMVVDDLHWADASRLSAFRSVARAAPGAALSVLATLRPSSGERETVADTVAAVERDPGAIHLNLDGLNVSAVSELVTQIAPHAPAEVAASLVADSGGNPFFLEALLADLAERGLLDEEPVTAQPSVPVVVRDVVGRRVSRLTESARVLLRAACVFSGPVPLAVSAAVAGLDEGDALDAIDDALAAHLLAVGPEPETYTFPHAIVRYALLDELSPSRRARAHRRAAEALITHFGADPPPALCTELAGQYHASASLSGAERGVPLRSRRRRSRRRDRRSRLGCRSSQHRS